MRRPPKSRKADGAHADTVSNLALCQHVDISAQANEAPSARGLRFGKGGRRQHVDFLTSFREGGNLHYSEVLTQGNEAPSARGAAFRGGGNLHYSEVLAKLRKKGGVQYVGISARANEAPTARGAAFRERRDFQYVGLGFPKCWLFGAVGPSKPPFALWYISSERRPSQIWA